MVKLTARTVFVVVYTFAAWPLICVSDAQAQSAAIRFKIGGRLTPEVRRSVASYEEFGVLSEQEVQDDSRRIVLGPSVEIFLPKRVSIDVGFLYRSQSIENKIHVVDLNQDPSDAFRLDFTTTLWTRVKSLEVPVIARYRLSDAMTLQPFIGAGYVHKRFVNPSRSFGGRPENTLPIDGLRHSSNGVAVDAGVELKLGFLKIQPEFRYTRWSHGLFHSESASSDSEGCGNRHELTAVIAYVLVCPDACDDPGSGRGSR